jgi:hypothetical protein
MSCIASDPFLEWYDGWILYSLCLPLSAQTQCVQHCQYNLIVPRTNSCLCPRFVETQQLSQFLELITTTKWLQCTHCIVGSKSTAKMLLKNDYLKRTIITLNPLCDHYWRGSLHLPTLYNSGPTISRASWKQILKCQKFLSF